MATREKRKALMLVAKLTIYSLVATLMFGGCVSLKAQYDAVYVLTKPLYTKTLTLLDDANFLFVQRDESHTFFYSKGSYSVVADTLMIVHEGYKKKRSFIKNESDCTINESFKIRVSAFDTDQSLRNAGVFLMKNETVIANYDPGIDGVFMIPKGDLDSENRIVVRQLGYDVFESDLSLIKDQSSCFVIYLTRSEVATHENKYSEKYLITKVGNNIETLRKLDSKDVFFRKKY